MESSHFDLFLPLTHFAMITSLSDFSPLPVSVFGLVYKNNMSYTVFTLLSKVCGIGVWNQMSTVRRDLMKLDFKFVMYQRRLLS